MKKKEQHHALLIPPLHSIGKGDYALSYSMCRSNRGNHGGEYNQVQNMVYVLEAHTRGSMGVLGGVVSKHKL